MSGKIVIGDFIRRVAEALTKEPYSFRRRMALVHCQDHIETIVAKHKLLPEVHNYDATEYAIEQTAWSIVFAIVRAHQQSKRFS